MSQMNMIQAIRWAHDVMLEKDPSVVAFGQDIGFSAVCSVAPTACRKSMANTG